jgi:SnoaL-like domain
MVKRNGFVAAALGAAVATVVAALAAQAPATSSAKPTTLTPADYVEIQQLGIRYSYALDTGADGGEMFAALFAPDGAFVSATRGRIDGHDKLVALGKGRNPMYPRRFIVNHVIEPAPDGATGRAYVVEIDLPSEGEKLGGELTTTGGRYEDVYEKTAAGWRFKSRQFVPSKMEVPGASAQPAPAPASR